MRFIDTQDSLPPETAVLANTESVLELAESIRGRTSVALQFPKWTDGRAYSQAVLLRGRLRYTGEIVATGDVVADMMPLLRRCGFTAVQLRADQKVETAQRTLGFYDGPVQPYQTTHAERAGSAAAEAQS